MVHCFILGDMGSGEEGQFKVAKAMKKKIDKVKDTFICGLGDNIYEAGVTCVDDPQFMEKNSRYLIEILMFHFICVWGITIMDIQISV